MLSFRFVYVWNRNRLVAFIDCALCTLYSVLCALLSDSSIRCAPYSIHNNWTVCIPYSHSIWYILSMICNMFNSARECCAEVDKTCNKSWIVQRIESLLYCLNRKFRYLNYKKDTKFPSLLFESNFNRKNISGNSFRCYNYPFNSLIVDNKHKHLMFSFVFDFGF